MHDRSESMQLTYNAVEFMLSKNWCFYNIAKALLWKQATKVGLKIK